MARPDSGTGADRRAGNSRRARTSRGASDDRADSDRVPRQERGLRRRDTIVAAAAELLTESGFTSVTHRTVANRCGVPLGSTTYYFRTLDSLLAAAARLLVDQWIDHGSAIAEDLEPTPAKRYAAERAARVLVRAVLPDVDRDALLAHYELLIGAVRHPAVAEVIRETRPMLNRMLADLITRLGCADWIGPDHVLAVVDGAVVSALSEGRKDIQAYAVRLLAAALE